MAFQLSAELFLPPANDNRSGAVTLRLPGSVQGSTLGATADESELGRCRLVGGVVWYRLASRRDGRILLRLTAAGQLDAALVVLERVRSRTEGRACAATDRRGRATAAFASRRGATYLIGVGHVANADPGTFRLDALASEAAESLRAGKALPRAGIRSSVHGLTDVNDVWRVGMQPGTTYRIGFSSGGCARVTLRAAQRLARSLTTLACSGYTTFTPGPDGGGSYVLEVVAGGGVAVQGYRLLFAAAAPDDLGVGVLLRNRIGVNGSLDRNRLDVIDVYHFDVEKRSDVRIDVSGGLTFQLVTDAGARLGTFSSMRRRLAQGRYVVAVRAGDAPAAARYRLALLVRGITSTSLRLESTTVPPRSPVELRPVVSAATSGAVVIQVDRFDPFTGWHFNRLLRTTVGASVAWAPPAEGRWRLRATYRGTIDASPSRSGYVRLEVRR